MCTCPKAKQHESVQVGWMLCPAIASRIHSAFEVGGEPEALHLLALSIIWRCEAQEKHCSYSNLCVNPIFLPFLLLLL